MDNINDILRAKRIVRQNGYRIEKPERDYDYEREDRMNLIRAKRIVKDAGYSYSKPEFNTGVTDDDEENTVPQRHVRLQRTGVDDNDRPFQGRGRFVKRNNEVPAESEPAPKANPDKQFYKNNRNVNQVPKENNVAPNTDNEQPKRKTRQEIYQDIAAKYV